jgi:hypothetical protein
MARNGKVNFRDLKDFRDKLEKNLTGDQLNLFIEACAKELAARLLAKVIKRTPVGQYPAETGKKGGTLRRGWTNGKSQAAHEYVGGLQVNHTGDLYVIEIINPVEYASYVEFGHRTRDHEGWVEGRFMLTISEQEIEADAPRVLENKLKKKLGECFK